MTIFKAIILRLKHLQLILLHPLWTWMVIGVLGILGTAAFIRDEFLSKDVAEKWKLLALLPHWPLSYWLYSWFLVLFIVLFEGSYRAQKKSEKTLQYFKEQLDRIGEDRPLDYCDSAWGIIGNNFHKSPPTFSLNHLDIIFENSSDRMINCKIKELFVEHEGNKIHIPLESNAGFYIQARNTMKYGFDIQGLSVSRFPAKIITGYCLEYDNVPPIKNRGTKRTIEHIFKSFQPVSYTNIIREKDEYWP